DEFVGKSVDGLNPALTRPILRALQTGKPEIHREATLLVANKQNIPTVFSTSLIRNQASEISDVILVFDDQSRLKSLELERNRAQQLAVVGTLAASLAHEIKNSLVSIRVLAELLPDKYADPEFRYHFSEIAISEIDRVDSLISQFRNLDESKLPQLVALNPISVLEDALSVLTSKIIKQQINVVRSYAPSFPKVRADADQLKQVFLNLLLNSLEAMEEPGEIWLKSFPTFGSSSQQTEVKEMVGISISDTGSGIANEDLEKIFDPFFTSKEEGTGLGLTISERIIDSFNGRIEFRNNAEGRGVTATVYLQKSSG
ncbi:MAG: ATP-binding protein, partial [Candidatus Poribacteria bacterium]|nr:ATP-binding protein [Candidatus Poribacteria bacterium]